MEANMEEFYKKYGLHDACITHVSIKNSDVILHFEGGVYQLDENGKETSLTPACHLIIKCVDDNFDQHIIIERCYKRKKSETITKMEKQNAYAQPVTLGNIYN